MSKKGFLTVKTYFPKAGDVLINENDDEMPARDCVRGHQWIDPTTGKVTRYALLVGRHPEFGAIPELLCEQPGEHPTGVFLDEVTAIHRAEREYRRTPNGTFAEK